MIERFSNPWDEANFMQLDANGPYIRFSDHETALAAEKAKVERLRAVLVWYENNTAGCRLIHSGGDAHRTALAIDGGNRARAALKETEHG